MMAKTRIICIYVALSKFTTYSSNYLNFINKFDNLLFCVQTYVVETFRKLACWKRHRFEWPFPQTTSLLLSPSKVINVEASKTTLVIILKIFSSFAGKADHELVKGVLSTYFSNCILFLLLVYTLILMISWLCYISR